MIRQRRIVLGEKLVFLIRRRIDIRFLHVRVGRQTQYPVLPGYAKRSNRLPDRQIRFVSANTIENN